MNESFFFKGHHREMKRGRERIAKFRKGRQNKYKMEESKNLFKKDTRERERERWLVC